MYNEQFLVISLNNYFYFFSAVSEQQDFRNRFKIVKVETTEPLKRGRWTCFDFVDKLAPKDKPPESDKLVNKSTPATQRPASSKPASVRPAAPAAVDPTTAGGRPTVESQVSAPVSGAVSEERELEGSMPNNVSYRQSNSVPPEALWTAAAGYSAGASYNQPPHSISIPPPSQANLTTLNQEQTEWRDWNFLVNFTFKYSFVFCLLSFSLIINTFEGGQYTKLQSFFFKEKVVKALVAGPWILFRLPFR